MRGDPVKANEAKAMQASKKKKSCQETVTRSRLQPAFIMCEQMRGDPGDR